LRKGSLLLLHSCGLNNVNLSHVSMDAERHSRALRIRYIVVDGCEIDGRAAVVNWKYMLAASQCIIQYHAPIRQINQHLPGEMGERHRPQKLEFCYIRR
jgi:hypothetical protein